MVYPKWLKTGAMLLSVIFLVAGCGLMKKKLPALPIALDPTRVVLEFEAAGDINPNPEGRPSPLFVRIYQLKTYSEFGNADFFSLYEKDEQVLARDLVGKEEIVLKPNEKRTVFFEAAQGAQSLGVIGLFTKYENIQWKAAAGLQANKTTVIRIQISGAGVIVR